MEVLSQNGEQIENLLNHECDSDKKIIKSNESQANAEKSSEKSNQQALGSRIIQDIEIVEQIAEGKTAKVFLVQDNKQKKYAQKVFKNEQKNSCKIMKQEIEILLDISHPNCNKLEKQDSSCIYLQFMENGDLLQKVQKNEFSEDQAKIGMRQLLSALVYLHKERNIAHRDIKLENILINSNNDLVLCDFGFSRKYKPGQKFEACVGTELYMSPQLLEGKSYDPEKNDIFALGVVLFSMVMGVPPYAQQASKTDPYYKFFIYGKQNKYWEFFQKKSDKKISKEFMDLINSMLDPNEQSRINLNEIMNHPWMKQ